jgi:Phytanoyl-CoA dioxygenase (PhyH)
VQSRHKISTNDKQYLYQPDSAPTSNEYLSTKITISPAELTKGEISPDTLAQAVRAIHTDGYVILENAVPSYILDTLHEKMDEDTKKLLLKPKWDAVGAAKGHLKQAPPPFAPYVFCEIVSNLFSLQVTKQILGEDIRNSFYSGNCNCPGSKPQPVHVDSGVSFLIVNVGLVDITEHNGSIELWPGTHLITDVGARLETSALDIRREIAPPIRANTKKGSILIRSPLVWHRGMQNYSDKPRHMIAMMHCKNDGYLGEPLKFNKGCEAEFENHTLHPNIMFTDEHIDYLVSDYSFASACKDTFFHLFPDAFVFLSKLQRRRNKLKS